MAKKLTSAKAKEILRDGTIRGKAISSKQKDFFGAIAGGQQPKRPRAGHQGSPFEKVNPPKFSALGKLGALSN